VSAYYNEFDPYAAEWLRNLIAAGHIAPGDVDEIAGSLSTRVMLAGVPGLKLVSLKTQVVWIVSLPMLADVQQFQVLNAVVGLVPVDVMYIVTRRDRTEVCFPHVPVEIRFGADRAGVVAVRPCGVLGAVPHDERQRLLRAELELALHEHLVDALPRHPERFANLREAEPIVVKLVHSVCLVILAMCWHINHLTPYRTRKAA
jgi:hypothetical protein